ncbi:TonB-dependent receptor [Aquincola sp. MAHUQ-54]|uniref:TonB-dependent receptor n=1 Tax=Aquincola agrisoli TaxID=3119538 RepID=A0AAW9Q731_9BURK
MTTTRSAAQRPGWPTLLALAAAAACAPAWAQAQAADAPSAGQVTVIGVTPLPGLGVPRDEVPANVQTGRAADMDRRHAPDLTNYMNRTLGGVHVNEIQNNPFQADVNFRGFTASPLLGTGQGLSVYVDGVRVNQPFGDVVSWDLIPRAAISSITLMPGSNPLFGLNTLGGALSVQTKDGISHPGTSVEFLVGSHQRRQLTFETGGNQGATGLDWYVTGNRFREDGWRDASPSDVRQLFGKLGFRSADTRIAISAAVADNDLTGNGLQEQRLLDRDYSSIYTKPDETHNRAMLLNLAATHQLGNGFSLSGNAYWRRVRTHTLNGDLNDDSLTESLYQPGDEEQEALAEAGYTGFPTSGESPANTPFPKWRCIANALLVDEPAEKCNGLLNTTRTTQRNWGLSGQLNWDGQLGGLRNQLALGAAMDWSRVHFLQGSELGYLTPDRGVVGVGAFGDGVTGGNEDGEPYDTRVDLSARTRTWSLFASDTLALSRRTHLTLAGRYNRTTIRSSDAILPGGGPGSLDGRHTFKRFNPAVGLTFSPTDALNAYVGFNQGSRAPSAIELGCADPANPCKLPNSMAGDPPLKQVVTSTLEAGLRGGVPGRYGWNVGVFRADNKNDILFVADDQAGFGYFKNFGKTRRQGLEAGLNFAFSRDLTLGVNYTYLDATYRSAEVVDGSSNSSNEEAEEGNPGTEGTINIRSGDRIPLIPRHMLKLFADWRVGGGWSLGADVTAVGGSIARGNENGEHEPDGTYYLGKGRSGGYAVLNLSADYEPNASWRFFVQVNNVFDRQYATAAQLGATGFDANGNFQARPFPANAEGERPLQHSTFYAPGAPRTVWAGVRYSFGK